MNLKQLLELLRTATPHAALVFSSDAGDIGSGYHVTEFKLSQVKGIDCGGRTTEWAEAAIQLLDGSGGNHMPVSKFVGILEKSIARVDGLGDAEVQVEYSPGNMGLRTYKLYEPVVQGNSVVINLQAAGAVCKPAQEADLDFGDAAAEPRINLEQSSCCKPAASTNSEFVSKRCCG